MFARRPARPAQNGYSVIDNQLSISGDIHTEGTIRIDGRIEGTLHRADTLIVGSGGTVVGNIEAREVVIGGTIYGSLSVNGRVEVQASATIQGDIHAAAVMLEEGGTVRGHLVIAAKGSEAELVAPERRLALTPGHSLQAIAQN
jgi:cytoskeletal protein CcmA (bactofilin family)